MSQSKKQDKNFSIEDPLVFIQKLRTNEINKRFISECSILHDYDAVGVGCSQEEAFNNMLKYCKSLIDDMEKTYKNIVKHKESYFRMYHDD